MLVFHGRPAPDGALRLCERVSQCAQDQIQDDQDRPDDHNVFDAEAGRIHPTPDERVEPADKSEYAVERALLLEKFDQHDDGAHQATETA